jgi:hypothetical protein
MNAKRRIERPGRRVVLATLYVSGFFVYLVVLFFFQRQDFNITENTIIWLLIGQGLLFAGE